MSLNINLVQSSYGPTAPILVESALAGCTIAAVPGTKLPMPGGIGIPPVIGNYI